MPAGLTIAEATGVLSWTPDETQGGQSFPVTVRVSDDGKPALSALRTFTVDVAEVNQPPMLAAITDATIDEGRELTFAATATDADLPVNALTFALAAGAPAGAAITTAGVFKWTPDEAQGPGTFPITVIVTDNGSPKLTDTKTFTVTVAEVNVPPVPAAVADQTLDLGGTLRLALNASDADLPAQTLAFSLVSGPSGLTVSDGGALDWTPVVAQAPSTNGVTVRVDDGVAGVTTSFTVTVRVPEVVLTGAAFTPDGQLRFVWKSVAGLRYVVQSRADLLAGDWQDAAGGIDVSGDTTTFTRPVGDERSGFFRVVIR